MKPHEIRTWTLPEIVHAIEAADEEPRTPPGFVALTLDERERLLRMTPTEKLAAARRRRELFS